MVKEEEKVEKVEKVIDKNVVIIGVKPFMNYVTAIKIQLDKNDKITVLARGKFISKAFDAIEVCKRNFLKNYKISYAKINIDSTPFNNSEGNEIYVSCISIELSKEEK